MEELDKDVVVYPVDGVVVSISVEQRQTQIYIEAKMKLTFKSDDVVVYLVHGVVVSISEPKLEEERRDKDRYRDIDKDIEANK